MSGRRPVSESLRNEAARRALAAFGSRMIPWHILDLSQRLAPSPSAIHDWYRDHHQVKPGFAMDDAALDFIVDHVRRAQPQAILEFGSGKSTIRLATEAAAYGGTLLSIDESDSFLDATREELAAAGVRATLAHRPLRPDGGYNLEGLADLLDGQHPSLLLIDGPSGGGNARYGTLAEALQYVQPGATFFLDDAFRDAEINVARQWTRMRGVRLRGIHPVGHGLLEGQVAVSRQAV